MKNKKDDLNKNKKDISNNVTPKKDATNHSAIYNVLGITYFIIMIIIIGFMFIRSSNLLEQTSVFLFVGFFILMILTGFKLKMRKKDIFLKPIKMFVMIVGIVYLFEFVSTGINNFGLINADSFDVYDVKQSHAEVLSSNNKALYFRADSADIFIIDETLTVNKVSKFSVYEEDKFDKETLKKTTKFYKLNDKVKFSYLLGNRNNEVILQITENDKRYLSQINVSGFVDLLKQNDLFEDDIYVTKEFSIFVNEELGLIGYFEENNFTVNEFDKIKNIKDTNYLQRGLAFLSNHYSEEYIESENMSIELVAEKVVNSEKIDKINLYSIRTQSGSQFYIMSNVIEVINKDGSSIIGLLEVNSDLMKEGVQIEK